jgi:hypothetical protein
MLVRFGEIDETAHEVALWLAAGLGLNELRKSWNEFVELHSLRPAPAVQESPIRNLGEMRAATCGGSCWMTLPLLDHDVDEGAAETIVWRRMP